MQIAGLNSQRARELFQSSDTKVKEMISLGIEDEEIQKLSQELESARRDILGEYDTEAEFYLDLTLLTDEFNGEEVAVSDEVIYILDKDSEKIVSVVIENKKTNIVAGPSSLDSPSDIAAYAGRVFVLTNEGITEVDNADVELSDFTTGNNWILSFASNIYVLDKDTSQIWKYSSLGESFTGPTKWLSEDQNTDFSDVISWAIDGNIWALKENADILKFTQGVEQNFSADGIYPQLENPKKIFSDENQEFLYLLEPDKTRIVVTSKDGEYKKQYISNKISDADEFAVSEKEGMILLLDSGVLYSIKL